VFILASFSLPMFVKATGVVSVALVDMISTSCKLTCVLSFTCPNASGTGVRVANARQPSNVLFFIAIPNFVEQAKK
jgi:hypothetical protein